MRTIFGWLVVLYAVVALGCGDDDNNDDDSTAGSGGAAGEQAGAGGEAGASGEGGQAGGEAGGGAGGEGDAGSPECGDDGTGWDLAWQAVECEVVRLINERRAQGATCGSTTHEARSPLSAHPLLTASARSHSQDMAENGFFDHTSSNGEVWNERIASHGYTGAPVTSDIASGMPDAETLVSSLMQSEGNCENVMNEDAADVGVGYYFKAGAQIEHYYTIDYGGG